MLPVCWDPILAPRWSPDPSSPGLLCCQLESQARGPRSGSHRPAALGVSWAACKPQPRSNNSAVSAPQRGTPGQGGALTVVSAGGRRGALGRAGALPGQQEPQASVRLRCLVCGQGLGALLRADGLIPCLRPDGAGRNLSSRQPHVAPDTDSGNPEQKGKEAAGRACPAQEGLSCARGQQAWGPAGTQSGMGQGAASSCPAHPGRPAPGLSLCPAPPSTPETRGHLPAELSQGPAFATAPPKLAATLPDGRHPRISTLRGTTPSCSWPSPGPHRQPRWCLPARAPGGITALARLTAAPGWSLPALGFQDLLRSC